MFAPVGKDPDTVSDIGGDSDESMISVPEGSGSGSGSGSESESEPESGAESEDGSEGGEDGEDADSGAETLHLVSKPVLYEMLADIQKHHFVKAEVDRGTVRLGGVIQDLLDGAGRAVGHELVRRAVLFLGPKAITLQAEHLKWVMRTYGPVKDRYKRAAIEGPILRKKASSTGVRVGTARTMIKQALADFQEAMNTGKLTDLRCAVDLTSVRISDGFASGMAGVLEGYIFDILRTASKVAVRAPGRVLTQPMVQYAVHSVPYLCALSDIRAVS